MLLALGLLLVGILGIVAVFVGGLKLSARANQLAGATQVGRELLERVRQRQRDLGFSTLPTGTYQYNGWANDPTTGAPPNAYPPSPYPRANLNQVDYTVVVYGQQPSAFLKTVKVEVYWNQDHFVTLETRYHP